MNLDEKIQHELLDDAQHVDELMGNDVGMFGMVSKSYRGGLGKWMILATVATIVVSVAMVWCGYEFAVAEDLSERVFWGTCLVVSVSMQIALKQWSWMEISRNSLLREIKRLEIAVLRLSNKVESE